MSGVEYSDGSIRQSSEPVPAEQGRSHAEPSAPEFAFDTSGRVAGELSDGLAVWYEFEDLEPLAQGYVKAAFADMCRGPISGRPCLFHPTSGDAVFVGFSDLAPETLDAMQKDCARMAGGVRSLFMATWALRREDGASLWAHRNGGEGWLDQGVAHAEALRSFATRRRFPPLVTYLSDAGKVYLAKPSP